MIHPTAIVAPTVKLGRDVKIGPYAVIEDDVEIGDGSEIETHAHVKSGARIGKNCTICSFSTIAGDPQDLHFDKSIKTYVQIGDNTIVREGATIHRATFEGQSTIIGKDCLLMANSHVGHDCEVGDRCIIAPFSALGGIVKMGCDVFVSGGVMVHQKMRVGEGAILSGLSAVSMDVPPYVNAYKRNIVGGLNLIGLRRRKVPSESIAEVKHLYMAVYADLSPIKNAKKLIEEHAYSTPEGEKFLFFFAEPGRHFIQPEHNCSK